MSCLERAVFLTLLDNVLGTGGGSDSESAESIAGDSADVEFEVPASDRKKLEDVGVQVDADDGMSTFVESISSSDQKLFSCTGIHSVKLLDSITKCFDEIAPEKKEFKISTRDRILFTMMKIKLGLSFSVLAIFFNLNVQTCSNYFFDTVSVLAQVLKCMIFWPHKETILKNMPKCFKGFEHTRVILDGFEIPIQRSKCVRCRVRSYSDYKKKFTAKCLMICTPSGFICLVCRACGGRASDKFITKHSGVLELCDFGEGVMVDKGFAIDDECDEFCLRLIRPPFLRKNKFSKSESVQCAKIARARVHVERVIQRVREYAFLKNQVPWNLVPCLDDVLIIVSALVNLGPPILANNKF